MKKLRINRQPQQATIISSKENKTTIRLKGAKLLMACSLLGSLFAAHDIEQASVAQAQELTTPYNPLADGKLNYISLGDSYAAGNATASGDTKYYGPNQPNSLSLTSPFGESCYMTKNAASFLLSNQLSSRLGVNVSHIHQACSGATTTEELNKDVRKNGSIEAQIINSKKSAYYNIGIDNNNNQTDMPFSMKEAELISLSTGGNDIGFADLLTCGLSNGIMSKIRSGLLLYQFPNMDCDKLSKEKIEQFMRDNTAAEVERLSKIYNKIAQEAPQATILISNYPSIVSTLADGYCNFNKEAVNGSVTLTNWINSVIDQALLRARQGQYNKLSDGSSRFILADIRSAFHTSLNPYDTRTASELDLRMCSPNGRDKEAVNGLSAPAMETGHPNVLGHRIISYYMQNALNSRIDSWKFNARGFAISDLDMNMAANMNGFTRSYATNPNSNSPNAWVFESLEYLDFDLNWGVKQLFHPNAVAYPLNPSNPFSWYAKREQGLNVNAACQNQYNTSDAFAVIAAQNVFGWTCNQWMIKGNVGLDLNSACVDQQGSGSYPGYFNYSDPSSWRCFRWQTNLDVNVDQACKNQVNPNSVAITFNPNSPYSWGCWLLNWRNQPVRYVGGVNLSYACKNQYGNPWNMNVYLAASNAYGWKCIGDRPISGIDMNRACVQQYSYLTGGINYPFRDTWATLARNDAYGWVCYGYRNNGSVNMNLAAKNQMNDVNAIATYYSNSPYAWVGRVSYGGLDLNNLAKLQTGNQDAKAKLLTYSIYGWKIEKPRRRILNQYDMDIACRYNPKVIDYSIALGIVLDKIKAKNSGENAYSWICVYTN